MRVTGIWTAVGAAIFGIILADLVHNPPGTAALANGAVRTETVAVNGLLGKGS